MPCDTKIREGQTAADRKRETTRAVERLEAAIAAGNVTVRIGPQGGVAFIGWRESDRDGVTDACAYRKLLAAGSPGLRRALARAEALAGRKVDERAVAAGWHTHDGRTWGRD